MTKYTISDAAQLYKKSRSTLYKDIKNGILSRDYNGMIDFSELIRVYGEPLSKKTFKRMNTPFEDIKNASEYISKNTDTNFKEMQKQIDFLIKQLEKAEIREAQANTRIDTLLTLIELKTPYTPQNELEKKAKINLDMQHNEESVKYVTEKKKGFFSLIVDRIKK